MKRMMEEKNNGERDALPGESEARNHPVSNGVKDIKSASSGKLWICPTPIGNLEDLTFRALRVLREVAVIAAEDTRRTRKLLSHYGIGTPLLSYHTHNQRVREKELLARLGRGEDVALVSDAGTPGISDPGAALIQQALARGIPVVALPGPSAVLTALVISGLDISRFVFEGFLPAKHRRRALKKLVQEKRTIVFFEAPHRLLATLKDIKEVLGDRPIVVARELTKVHEEVFRGLVSGAIEHFRSPKGEITIVLAGQGTGREKAPPAPGDIRAVVQQLVAHGIKKRAAIKEAARRLGMSSREVYAVMESNESKE